MTSVLRYHTDAEINEAATVARQTFNTGYTKSIKYRRHQLQQLWRLLDENTDVLIQALHKDLRKHKNECMLGEIIPTKEEINHTLEHLDEWAKDEVVTPSLINKANKCLIRKEAKGAVLIIAPWNYPVFLSFGPLLGAIAAGCTAVIKPSELSPHSSKAMTDLLPLYLDSKAYQIINGAAHETTLLLNHKWDHIFYTGNGVVAKIIMKAAAQYLTPLTLELGGKSPVIVGEDANLKIVAKRLVFGKCFNTGQTCVAPDYVMVTEAVEDKLIAEMKKAAESMYGANSQKSNDFGRIINNRHFHRLQNALNENKSGEVVLGQGQADEKDLFIPLTIVKNVDRDDKLMQDEIFGPILPFVRVADLDDAIEFINSRDEPLALYVFSENQKLVKKVLDSTRSGGVLINDTLMHVAEGSLPFGGVGPSGMGACHGKKSFDIFTHERSTMIKNLAPLAEAIGAARYAPYTPQNLKLASLILETVPTFKKSFVMKHLKWIVLAVIFGVGYRRVSA